MRKLKNKKCRCGSSKFILKNKTKNIIECMWCGEQYILEQNEEIYDINTFLQNLDKEIKNKFKIKS